MAKPETMAELERNVFMAVARLGKNAYGMAIRRDIAKRTKRDVSLGSVYAALERLQAKQFVSSIEAPGIDSTHGGLGRRYFSPKPQGFKALEQFREEFARMFEGLEGLKP
jgi:PadR family transcriptional regulator, regulatory protein PadR